MEQQQQKKKRATKIILLFSSSFCPLFSTFVDILHPANQREREERREKREERKEKRGPSSFLFPSFSLSLDEERREGTRRWRQKKERKIPAKKNLRRT